MPEIDDNDELTLSEARYADAEQQVAQLQGQIAADQNAAPAVRKK